MNKRILKSVLALLALFPAALAAHPLPESSGHCAPDGSCLGHALEHLSAAVSVMQTDDWWDVYAVVVMFIMVLITLKMGWILFVEMRAPKRCCPNLERNGAG